MAETPKRTPTADLYSVDDDGNKVDAWIFEELLGDDPLDEDYATNLDDPEDGD